MRARQALGEKRATQSAWGAEWVSKNEWMNGCIFQEGCDVLGKAGQLLDGRANAQGWVGDRRLERCRLGGGSEREKVWRGVGVEMCHAMTWHAADLLAEVFVLSLHVVCLPYFALAPPTTPQSTLNQQPQPQRPPPTHQATITSPTITYLPTLVKELVGRYIYKWTIGKD